MGNSVRKPGKSGAAKPNGRRTACAARRPSTSLDAWITRVHDPSARLGTRPAGAAGSRVRVGTRLKCPSERATRRTPNLAPVWARNLQECAVLILQAAPASGLCDQAPEKTSRTMRIFLGLRSTPRFCRCLSCGFDIYQPLDTWKVRKDTHSSRSFITNPLIIDEINPPFGRDPLAPPVAPPIPG